MKFHTMTSLFLQPKHLNGEAEEESGRCWGSRTPPQKWAQGRDFKEKKKKIVYFYLYRTWQHSGSFHPNEVSFSKTEKRRFMCWNARLADGFAGIPTLIRLHALHCFNITGHVKVAPIHSWKCWFAAAGCFSLKRCGVFPAFSSFVGETQGRNSALTRGGGDPFRRRVWVWRACPQEKGPKKKEKPGGFPKLRSGLVQLRYAGAEIHPVAVWASKTWKGNMEKELSSESCKCGSFFICHLAAMQRKGSL